MNLGDPLTESRFPAFSSFAPAQGHRRTKRPRFQLESPQEDACAYGRSPPKRRRRKNLLENRAKWPVSEIHQHRPPHAPDGPGPPLRTCRLRERGPEFLNRSTETHIPSSRSFTPSSRSFHAFLPILHGRAGTIRWIVFSVGHGVGNHSREVSLL